MISEKLLSEVLGIKIDKLLRDSRKSKPNTIVYDNEELNDYGVINIHELANKCKEWAWKNFHVRLESGRLFGTAEKRFSCVIDTYNGNKFYYGGNFIITEATTEPEAIFSAGQWILDQRGKDA